LLRNKDEKESTRWLRKAVEAFLTLPDEQLAMTVTIWPGLAETVGKSLIKMRMDAEAENLLKAALDRIDLLKKLGVKAPQESQILHDLTFAYVNQKKTKDAEPIFRRYFALREEELGKENPAMASDWHVLALLCRHSKKNKEAEAAFKRAISLAEKDKKAGPAQVARYLEDYANFLTDMMREDDARAVRERARTLKKQFKAK
jgi:tetratricopeptide (TPR) repeat protein